MGRIQGSLGVLWVPWVFRLGEHRHRSGAFSVLRRGDLEPPQRRDHSDTYSRCDQRVDISVRREEVGRNNRYDQLVFERCSADQAERHWGKIGIRRLPADGPFQLSG